MRRMNDHLLRQYRLGRLSEAERHEIERRAFEDDAFEEKLLEAESDLLDDWARGTLTEEDGKAVERAFTKEQLEVARSVNRLIVPNRGLTQVPAPAAVAGWPYWAVAAALLIGLLPSLYFWQRGAPVVPKPEAPAAQGEIALLTLHVPTTRGTTAPKIRVPSSASWIRVALDAEPGYEFYEVRVESARSGMVFEQTIRSAPPVTLTVPASLLVPGEYDFVVSGRKNGETTLLATYACGIERN